MDVRPPRPPKGEMKCIVYYSTKKMLLKSLKIIKEDVLYNG